MTATKEELIWKGSPSQILNFWWWAACVLVIPIPFALWKWLEVRSRVYEITNERVKFTQGIFTRRTDELELYRVRDSSVVQPFWHRLVGKGNIILNTTDTTTPTFVIECIPGAEALRDQMRSAIEICRDRKRARVAELGGAIVDGGVDETHG